MLPTTVLLPLLRRLSLLFAMKTYLNESLTPTRLDALLPGIERGWVSLVGTLTILYYQLYVYTAQFESLLARWPEERFALLQTDTPSVNFILIFLSVEQVKDAAKEVELVEMSSRSVLA